MIQHLRACFHEIQADGSSCCLLLGKEPLPSDLVHSEESSKAIRVSTVAKLSHTHDALNHADSLRAVQLTPCGLLFWTMNMELNPTQIQSFQTIRKMSGALVDGFLCFLLSPRRHHYTCLPSDAHRVDLAPPATAFEPVCFVDLIDGVPAGVSFQPRSVAEILASHGHNESGPASNALNPDAKNSPVASESPLPDTAANGTAPPQPCAPGNEASAVSIDDDEEERAFKNVVIDTLRALPTSVRPEDLTQEVYKRIRDWFPRNVELYRSTIDSIMRDRLAQVSFCEKTVLESLLAACVPPLKLVDPPHDGDCFFVAADRQLRMLTGFSFTRVADITGFRRVMAGAFRKLNGTILGQKIARLGNRDLVSLSTSTAAVGINVSDNPDTWGDDPHLHALAHVAGRDVHVTYVLPGSKRLEIQIAEAHAADGRRIAMAASSPPIRFAHEIQKRHFMGVEGRDVHQGATKGETHLNVGDSVEVFSRSLDHWIAGDALYFWQRISFCCIFIFFLIRYSHEYDRAGTNNYYRCLKASGQYHQRQRRRV